MQNARGGAQLRGPFRGLGIQPLVSAVRGLGHPLRAPERLLEGPPLRAQQSGEKAGLSEALRDPVSHRVPDGLGLLPSGHR